MTTATLIGFTGYAGSGKDTAADVLVRWRHAKRVAFADPMREALNRLDPIIHRKLRLNDALADAGWKMDTCPACLGRGEVVADIPCTTCHRRGVVNNVASWLAAWDTVKWEYPDVRRLLQVFGTDIGRTMMGENVWVDLALRACQGHPLVVLPDVRFANEATALINNNGFVVRIERPGVGPVNQHVSDEGLPDALVVWTIVNDGTVMDLEEKVLDRLGDLESSVAP